MKFRPKKSKVEQLSEIMTLDIDDPSDDEFVETEQINGDFGQNAPLTPPGSPPRRKIIKYSRDVLRLNLHHGDILIQQGSGLQKYYEVSFRCGQR
jgi:hypothetical protein